MEFVFFFVLFIGIISYLGFNLVTSLNKINAINKDVQYDDSRKISEDNIEYKSGNIEEKTYDAEPVEFDDSNDYIN